MRWNQIVQELLRRKADPIARNSEQTTPLHMASMNVKRKDTAADLVRMSGRALAFAPRARYWDYDNVKEHLVSEIVSG